MENIDIIIVAGVSFLLVVGGLFIGMYLARRTEAVRTAKLDEREERLLRMRARFEHERFAIAAAESGEDVELDEDLFKGFKEEIEQERMELDMRREELELDLRMLEEENERLKSRLTGKRGGGATHGEADEATVVEMDIEEATVVDDDIEDAVFAEAPEDEDAARTEDAAEPAAGEADDDTADAHDEDDDRDEAHTEPDGETVDHDEVVIARNTIFGDFDFDDVPFPDFDEPDPDEQAAAEVDPVGGAPEDEADDRLDAEPANGENDGPDEETEPAEDGWSTEPDEIDEASINAELTQMMSGDGAAMEDIPEGRPSVTRGKGERSEPARPAFDHMLTADDGRPADGSIQQVLGLSDSDLALMNDLGYGTFRSIADLTGGEITRLAEAFDISEKTIREQWIPDARTRVAREPRA